MGGKLAADHTIEELLCSGPFGLLGGEEIRGMLGLVYGVPLGVVKGISEVAVGRRQ
jgi:hypothetical protein